MDVNGKRLEIIGFHTSRYLTRIQRQAHKNKHISCRMLGQLWLYVTFALIILSYPVAYKVVKVLQACLRNFWKCSNTNINDRKRKTKKTLCSACMCRGLIWTFYIDEEVCLLLCMERSSFPLPQDGINGCRHWRSRIDATMDFICDHMTIAKFGRFLRHSW